MQRAGLGTSCPTSTTFTTRAPPSFFMNLGADTSGATVFEEDFFQASAETQRLMERELSNIGPELRLAQLIEHMEGRTDLFAEVQAQFQEWILEFKRLSPTDVEGRTLFLAILVIQILWPAMLTANSTEEQDQFCSWEVQVQIILEQLLPEEDVTAFIEECDQSLRKEALEIEKNEHIATAQRMDEVAFSGVEDLNEEATELIRRSLERIQQLRKVPLIELEKLRRETLEEGQTLLDITSTTQALSEEILTLDARAQENRRKCKSVLLETT